MTPPSRISIGGLSTIALSSSLCRRTMVADLFAQCIDQRRIDACQQLLQPGQPRQCRTELCQVARTRGAQCDARQYAFHVADTVLSTACNSSTAPAAVTASIAW